MKLLVTVSLFVVVAMWIARWLERRVLKLDALAPNMRIGIAKFTQAFLVGLSVLVGLNAAGLDLTTLNVLTGAIGIGLGFGLQSIAANFVSGFVLLMDRSIKPGDVISFTGMTGHHDRGFRLGQGAARTLRRGPRPRRRGDAGAEPAPDHQPGDQLELHRPARAPEAAGPGQLPQRSRTRHAAPAPRRPRATRASSATRRRSRG